jgi:lipoprotein-anchoring transpeptidase ErfK/SrfK
MRRSMLALAGAGIAFALSASGTFAQDRYASLDRTAAYGADPLSHSYGYGEQDDYVRPQATNTPRELVTFDTRYNPGTIVVSTEDRQLYYVTRRGEAIAYSVGVGRPGFTWAGTMAVTRKREWPDWRPPVAMLKRRPDLPRYMPGGLDNPLGARALYLGSSEYRIHGSNEPETIGEAVSSGCIRMTNEDVTDLYNRVRVGAKVVVLR